VRQARIETASMTRKTNRAVWALVAALAVIVLGGVGLLGVRLRPYWIAMYRGHGPDLQQTVLIYAPFVWTPIGRW
jgi:hypothetical protein